MSGYLCGRCVAERLDGCGDGRGFPACQAPRVGPVESCPCYAGNEYGCPLHGPLAYVGVPARDDDYARDVGSKDDASKPRTDLLPFAALIEVAHVMTFGATKYEAYNWRGLSASRLFAAALRHLWAWWLGEDLDPETGRSHVAHAACCVLMVLAQVLERPEYDDRPK